MNKRMAIISLVVIIAAVAIAAADLGYFPGVNLAPGIPYSCDGYGLFDWIECWLEITPVNYPGPEDNPSLRSYTPGENTCCNTANDILDGGEDYDGLLALCVELCNSYQDDECVGLSGACLLAIPAAFEKCEEDIKYHC